VQRYCSMTSHAWMGIHMSFGVPYWKKLPATLQEMCERHFRAAALAERNAWSGMTDAETGELAATGMVFNQPDIAAFRKVLDKSGYYPAMRQQAGAAAWTLLEKFIGPLA
jgi:TRAP-type transport system periplasmic protein